MSDRVVWMRVRTALLSVVVTAGGLVPVFAAVAPPASAATKATDMNAASPCQDVVFVGARGSGEDIFGNYGMGPKVVAAAQRYSKALPTRRVGYYGVIYVAHEAVAWNFVIPSLRKKYLRGISEGVDHTVEFLNARHKRCPSEKVVLAGYSQGAMVMHRVVFRLNQLGAKRHGHRLRDRVIGVVAIADGDRTAGQSGRHYGSKGPARKGDFGVGFAEWASGVKTKYPPRAKRLPDWVVARFHSVCDAGDIVCDFSKVKAPRKGLVIHTKRYGRKHVGVSNAVAAVVKNTRRLKPVPAFTIVDRALPAAKAGHAYSRQLTAKNAPGPYRWTVRGLPAGFTMTTTGRITGSPTRPASWTFKVGATDKHGQTTWQDVTLRVVRPVEPASTDAGWVSVSGGRTHTCGTKLSGQLWCWGSNSLGQLGDSTEADSGIPVRTGSSGAWSSVAAGHLHACGASSGGQLWCWGNNSYGQAGVGDTLSRSAPARVGSASDWSGITAGRDHTCGVRGGQLWCWGANLYSELGVGDNVDRSAPARVGSHSDWSTAVAGQFFSCGIRAGGQVWCWGNNIYGQLGVGDTVDRLTPVRVGSASDWASISVGSHACGVRSGQLWCWGTNTFGQLGVGDTVDRLTPVRVGSASDWASISVGTHRTCGVRGGQLWCWGTNTFGQLGLGDTDERSTPVRVGSASDWWGASTGDRHVCGVRGAGQLWCWGSNLWGQLGIGGTEDQLTPAQVTG